MLANQQVNCEFKDNDTNVFAIQQSLVLRFVATVFCDYYRYLFYLGVSCINDFKVHP